MNCVRSQQELWCQAQRDTYLLVGFTERTGLAAARLFEAKGVRYKISDCAPREELLPRLEGLQVAEQDVYSGDQHPTQLEGITKILLSPGVPRSIPLLQEALRRSIPVWTDIDFLYPFLEHKKIVAVTGTDGKTTTTALLGELLQPLGPVVVAGNIGIPVLSKYDEILRSSWVVLELSSFMLEQVSRFRADLAVVLNVAQDHIERYSSLEEYARVKLGIVQHGRSGDVFVKNLDDPFLASFSPTHVRVRTLSERDSSADSYYEGGVFHVLGQSFRHSDCLLQGVQNVVNILAAVTIAREAGVQPEQVAQTLRAFRGIPHRLERVGSYRGVEVYDDSKATNVHAVEAALRNFASGVVLILGGRDKGLDFSILRQHASRIRCWVCYGEHGLRIREQLEAEPTLYEYRFEDAVKLALRQCKQGDVLLLSPGCTSWDQFDNYEVRAAVFREIVLRWFA